LGQLELQSHGHGVCAIARIHLADDHQHAKYKQNCQDLIEEQVYAPLMGWQSAPGLS